MRYTRQILGIRFGVVVTFMMVYIALYDAYDARKHRYSRCFVRASNTGYKSAGRLGYETREGGWLWEGGDHIYVYIYSMYRYHCKWLYTHKKVSRIWHLFCRYLNIYIYTLSLICLFIYAFIHIHLFIFIHVYMYSEYTHLREVRHKYVRHACTYMHLYIYIYVWHDMWFAHVSDRSKWNECGMVWYGMSRYDAMWNAIVCNEKIEEYKKCKLIPAFSTYKPCICMHNVSRVSMYTYM